MAQILGHQLLTEDWIQSQGHPHVICCGKSDTGADIPLPITNAALLPTFYYQGTSEVALTRE
jgi:hypothetical protein